MADQTSEEPTVPLTWSTRFMNTILCRGDLSQEKLDAQPVSISELIRYATFSDKILLVLGMSIAVILGAIHPLPVIVEGVIANIYLKDPNHIGNDSLLDQSLLWCEIVAGVGVISATLAYLQSYFLMRACSNIVRTIRREFVKAVLHQEAEWFDGTQAGAITAKLNDNVERIRDGMADKVGLILRGFSMFTSSAVFSFIVNWRVTLVCIGIGPLGAITMSLMARLSAKPMREQMEAGNEAASVAEEAIMNVKTVAACNGQKHMVEKYKNILDECRKIAVRTCLVNGFCEGFLVFQMYLFFTAGLVYGIIGFFNGDTTEPGSVIMASNAILVGAYFLSQLGPHMMAVLKARVAAAVIYKIIDRKPSDVSTLNEGLELTNCEGRIECSNVHFKYPTRDTPVLNGCSWTAEAGEMIAFVGHSGCGKSTSIGLITRLYAQTNGNITIDGVPIEQLNVKSLRKVIGIVSQEPCLFNGTIKENIVLDRTVTDEMVEEAAKTANAHGFIEKLENGYETVLGVGGVSLSGGQKQRIAIARAIVTKPKILILDEATSALDSESERIVQLALNRASKGRTTIMIAHRLSTLRDVQRIHVMEGGIITERGNHLELCAKGGLYASLAKAQQVGIMEKPIKPEVYRRISESLSHKDQEFHDELSCEPFMRSSIRASGKLPNPIHNENSGDEKGEIEVANKGELFSSWTFLRLYFATGKWTWQMFATIVCVVLRTVDMPAYSYLSIFPYLALQSTKDDYMHYVWLTLITYSFMAFYLWLFIGTALGFGGYSAETLVNRLRVMCLKNLLQRDAAYFDEPEKSNAQCVTTISLHTPPLQACFDYRFIMICNNVIAVFFCLVVAFVISWQIGVTILVFISISGILFYILTKVTNKCMSRKDTEDKTPEARTIQLLVAEDYFSERYSKYQDNAEPWETKLNSLQSLTFSFTLSFLFFSEALFYAVGVHCIYIGAATAAVVFVAVMAGNMAGFAVIFASPSFNDFMKANASANALFKLIGNDQTENKEEPKKPLIEGSLSVENVEFAYPTRPDTLHIGNDSLLDQSLLWCEIVAGVGVISATLAYLQSYFLMRACSNIVRTIRREFVKAVLHQEAEWFDGTQAGAITAKLNDNVERIRDGMADKVGLILRGFSMFTSSAVFSFIVNWRVTLVCIGIGPLGAITMSLMARLSAKPMREQMEAGNEAASVAEEAIMNVKTVAACNGQKHMVEKYKNILDECRKIAVRTCLVNGFCEGFLVFQMYLFFTAGLVYGIIGFFNGDTTEPGSVIMASNAILVGAYFLSQLGPHMMAVLKARVAAAVIYKIIDRKPSDVSTLNEGLELTNCEGRIECSNVHFKYPTRDTPVLNGCSWTAEAGEMIAFVGHSGCGKSTSIGLITRLYAQTNGNITIDGVPIEQLNVKSLRKVIGIVSQEPCLFNGTIKENIVLDRTVTDEMVEEAAKTANAHGFIEKLENGYETVLGVGGVSLSGGQKQRIAIARAIVTKPKILILDEATSALDSESERIVQLALNRASKGRTTIMIAHRLSTLRDVQRIHVMEGGIITERGNHLELCAKGGLYASLAKAQQVGIMEKPIKPEVYRRISESLSHKDQEFHDELSCEPFMRSSIRASGKLPNPIHNENSGDEKGEIEVANKGELFSSWTFLRLYFATGKWTWQMFATIVCVVLRTVDMPAYSYLSIFPYLALQSTKDDYMHYVWLTLITYSFMAFYLWLFIGTALGFGGYSAETLVNRLRVMCLKNLLQRDAAYFDEPEKSNAQCVTTISLHTPPLQACFDYRFIMICNNVIAVFFCLVVAFVISWQIGVTILVFISISGILFYILTKVTNKCMSRKDTEDKTPEARTIQLLVAEDYFSERYSKYQDNAEPWETKLNSLQSLTFSFTLSFLFFSEALFYAVGVHCIYIGAATAAVVFVAVMAGNMAGFAVIFASPSFNDFMKANASANALFKLIGNDQTENKEEPKKPLIEGSLSVENVEFAYPTRPDTLVARDLSLSASNGQSIALVGASGCGKSTIMQLIERFYEPLKGNINVDGTSIQSMSLHHLRENLALVGQEPVLFKGSILENIMLGCDNVTFENVRKVAEMANAAHFIENLPQGYETDVGEKGKALSGGQKQRIAIARALIRNPKILLLDEATSALDTQSEEKVQVALNEASTGRTSITIAHRLSTIKKCDRIFYIENGSVLETGTHDELLSANGKYAMLVEAQTLDH